MKSSSNFSFRAVIALLWCVISTEGSSNEKHGHSKEHHHMHKLRIQRVPKSSQLKPELDPMSKYFLFYKNCESYDWGTNVCDGYNDLWDCPETPLEQRNNIGRAVFQTPELVQRASKLIQLGITYNIHHEYSNAMQSFATRTFETHPLCYTFHSDTGYCDTAVDTSAIGNVASQFDGLAHFYWRDGDQVDDNDASKGGIFFNNFRWDDVYDNTSNSNFHYIGIEQLPQFFTRCILIDLAEYLAPQSGVLARGYEVTKDEFIRTLEHQGLYLNRNFRFERGDVVLFRFGSSKYWYDGTQEFFGLDAPGIAFDIVEEFFWDSGVMILGSDFSISAWNVPQPFLEDHRYWLGCGGGFIHELLMLDEWADDAKKGFVPYVGVYSFGPLPVRGAAGGAGKPVIFV